ncbi:hypothetical protein D3Y57_09800 [Sphingomonas paeninsulae]|uniref:Uncharacterized protein n=1 Tax=Sphingomonas paeninsulae TaxID=2319844 RepID=A0A494TFQ6_SPHPE|nr:hypothetical protein [Sphingomonas paeninsulae]AYJ86204.1 hypothetical protein D3Y57_09800 [Sphingomonas paeninsulae]
MSDTEVKVSIIGDASAVAPATAETKAQLESIDGVLESLNAGFASLAAIMKESMQSGAASTAEMVSEMHKLEEETEKESFSLKEMAARAKEGAEAMVEMRESLMGIGELILAVFAVEFIKEWTEHMAEAAELVEHLSQRFGMATSQIQGLQGAALGTGVAFDTITKGMAILDKNFEKSPDSFAKLGIAVASSKTQMDILLATADRFKGMEDGPNKVALAMHLMGRNGAEMIPFLNQGADGLQELITKSKEYGMVNDDAIAKGMALAESVNESKMAWAGLKTTLMDAFAPLLKEMVDNFNNLVKSMTESYEAGGFVKQAFEIIVTLFEGLGEIIDVIGSAIGEFFSQTGADTVDWANVFKVAMAVVVDAFKAVAIICGFLRQVLVDAFEYMAVVCIQWGGKLQEVFDEISLGINVLGALMKTTAIIIADALTMQWTDIAADWREGMNSVDAEVKAGGARIVADARKTASDANAEFAKIGKGDAAFQAWADGLMKPAAPKPTGVKEHEAPKGGDAGPNLEHTPKAKKEKDTVVSDLNDILTAKKLAWAMEQDAQGTAQAYSLQSEADYWAQVLTRTDLSTKDRAQVETKYLAVNSQLVKERIAIVIDGYKAELAEADKNATAKLAIATQELAYVARMYGQDSAEYKAAQAQIVTFKKAAAAQIREIDDIAIQSLAKSTTSQINAADQAAQHRVAMGRETTAQLIAEEQRFEDAKYQIEQASLQREKALIPPGSDPVQVAKINAQLLVAYQKYQDDKTKLTQKAEIERTKIETTATNATKTLFANNLASMLTLQQGFGGMITSLYKGMVSVISGALSSVIENWLSQQLAAFLTKRAMQSGDGAITVTSNAAIAASAAFASTAAIPIVGPALAPAAAATAMGAVMSFAPMASMAGGNWQVSDDMIAQIHKDEMVLPARLAAPLRSMINGGGGNDNTKEAANSNGDTHIHLNVNAVDAKSVKRMLMEHKGPVADALKLAYRDGKR